MTRLAHIADTHLDESAPHCSLDEQVDWLKAMGADAQHQGAEIMLHGGDMFERASTPGERMAAADVLTFWSDRMPVVMVRGNHDRNLDLDLFERLESVAGITVYSRPCVVKPRGVDLAIACLPWPRREFLAAASMSGHDLQSKVSMGLGVILDGLAGDLADTGARLGQPTILLGHVELGGAELDSGQPVVGRCDVAIHLDDILDVGADYVALGHIHKRQILEGRVAYPGSPRATAFGQDEPKGYLIVDVEPGQDPVIEFRESLARRLVTVGAEWDGPHGLRVLTTGDVGAGDAVRLSYTVDASDRVAAGEQAGAMRSKWLAAGAHSVKLDPTINPVHRVRSELIQTAANSEDRLRAHWEARGQVPDRSDELMAKLNQTESTQ